MHYYAQVGNYFVNYLFRKDLSYYRLKDTELLTHSIIYDKKQIDVLRKIHPDLFTTGYYNHSHSRAKVKRKPLNNNKHILSILKHLS